MANGLTDKQQIFVYQYLKCFNATEAARRAGYAATNGSLRSIGSENLTKPNIAEAIRQHLQESAMSADEVLMRLAEQARGNIGEFANIENSADLAKHPQSNLVKKFKKRVYRPRNESDDPYEDIEIELYDAHSALVDIGKKHSMFSDNVNVKLEKELEQILDVLERSLDSETYQKVIKVLSDDSN